MQRFCMALTFLSILVMAQGVVAVEPMPNPVEIGIVDAAPNLSSVQHSAAAIGGTTGPDGVTMALLLMGIWGLTLVGNRMDPDRQLPSA